MKYLDDEVVNPIFQEIATAKNMSVDQVRNIVKEYYDAIAYLIESGKPCEIKIDYFAKIRAKKKFLEIEQKIVTKNFSSLVPRNYEVLSDK